MNTHVIRAMRVMAPNDVRLIWRDGFFMSFMIVVIPLASLGLHWLVPFVGDLVAQWVELEPYYGLIVANVVVAGEPVLLGFVVPAWVLGGYALANIDTALERKFFTLRTPSKSWASCDQRGNGFC